MGDTDPIDNSPVESPQTRNASEKTQKDAWEELREIRNDIDSFLPSEIPNEIILKVERQLHELHKLTRNSGWHKNLRETIRNAKHKASALNDILKRGSPGNEPGGPRGEQFFQCVDELLDILFDIDILKLDKDNKN